MGSVFKSIEIAGLGSLDEKVKGLETLRGELEKEYRDAKQALLADLESQRAIHVTSAKTLDSFLQRARGPILAEEQQIYGGIKGFVAGFMADLHRLRASTAAILGGLLLSTAIAAWVL